MIVVQAEKLRCYCQELFEKVGVPSDEAYRNADNLVDADLKGVEGYAISTIIEALTGILTGSAFTN